MHGYDEMVVLRDIRFESHCEHHLAPIIGRVHVGYLPDAKVVGISKLARVVDAYARRLQVQEKMNAQIANCIQHVLEPKGVAVVIEASHQCMTTRGVHKTGRHDGDLDHAGRFPRRRADAARIPQHDRQSRLGRAKLSHSAMTAASSVVELTKRLIAFDTTSRNSNLELIAFARRLCSRARARGCG